MFYFDPPPRFGNVDPDCLRVFEIKKMSQENIFEATHPLLFSFYYSMLKQIDIVSSYIDLHRSTAYNIYKSKQTYLLLGLRSVMSDQTGLG